MTPFTVLMVCVGNICRSPMAERLLAARLRERAGPDAARLVRVHGAGTGDWHVGRPMHPVAAAEVRRRGGDPDAFGARLLSPAMVAESDLVLTASSDQVRLVVASGASVGHDARAHTFVLGEFVRLVDGADLDALPPFAPTAEAVAARGRALVAALDGRRDGVRGTDEVPDPYGLGPEEFAATADQIDRAVDRLADLLTAGAVVPR